MKTRLLIFPYSGTGLEAMDCLGDVFAFLGFIDDDPSKQAAGAGEYPVLSREAISLYPDAQVLLVPGSPANYSKREALIAGFGIREDRLATVIHPSARISRLARIGRNTLLMAGVVVTSDAQIGSHVCVLPNTVVHHGVRIGDFALVGSNVTLAGDVQVGRNVYLGSATSVIGGVHIGDGALVGMGANVIRPVPPGFKVVGNPARAIGPAR